jgi:hypothetical protein
VLAAGAAALATGAAAFATGAAASETGAVALATAGAELAAGAATSVTAPTADWASAFAGATVAHAITAVTSSHTLVAMRPRVSRGRDDGVVPRMGKGKLDRFVDGR